MCGKPHVLFVPEARGVEDTDPGVGNIEHLLLGLYGLLAVLSLARLVIPSLSTSLTAFQVLQEGPCTRGDGNLWRVLSLFLITLIELTMVMETLVLTTMELPWPLQYL